MFGVRDRSVVAHPRGWQAASLAVHEVLGRLECFNINGVLEDMHDGFANALGRPQVVALLDAMQAADELGWQDEPIGRLPIHGKMCSSKCLITFDVYPADH